MPKFLLLDSNTTLRFSASPFMPPAKPCDRRWALRKILAGTQPYSNHSTISPSVKLQLDPCSAQTEFQKKLCRC